MKASELQIGMEVVLNELPNAPIYRVEIITQDSKGCTVNLSKIGGRYMAKASAKALHLPTIEQYANQGQV